jgi:hypothetical protein
MLKIQTSISDFIQIPTADVEAPVVVSHAYVYIVISGRDAVLGQSPVERILVISQRSLVKRVDMGLWQ